MRGMHENSEWVQARVQERERERERGRGEGKAMRVCDCKVRDMRCKLGLYNFIYGGFIYMRCMASIIIYR